VKILLLIKCQVPISSFLGKPGICFTEILLSSDFKGQGLAAAKKGDTRLFPSSRVIATVIGHAS